MLQSGTAGEVLRETGPCWTGRVAAPADGEVVLFLSLKPPDDCRLVVVENFCCTCPAGFSRQFRSLRGQVARCVRLSSPGCKEQDSSPRQEETRPTVLWNFAMCR